MTRALWVLLLLPACSGLGERVGRAARGEAALDSAAVAESAAAARSGAPPAVFDSGLDTTVSYERLEALVRAAPESVRAVMQRRDRRVTVVLLDGRRYNSTQPAMDGIISLVHSVDPSGRILIATE
ncbi:MAG: hypothetical protein SF070_00465 [Gemmatimonadota bacterium]|nr:hypothetical protein [Gemmatimonadota bacterium]